MSIRIIITILVIGFLSNCRTESDDFAKDKTFYYTVSSPSKNTANLIHFLNENINNKRVTITNQSGLTSPFYYVLNDDEKLPYDSLMPPHYFIHAMKKKNDNEIPPGDYFVDFKVMLEADTLPNYELTVFLMDSEGLKRTGYITRHYIDPILSADSALLYDTFLKSLIRYSFK